MAYNSGVITAPVSIYDIQQALGVTGGGDLGTLAEHENINMWSKFKPVKVKASSTYGSTRINTYPLLKRTTKRWNESLTFQWWRDTDVDNNLSRYGILPIIGTSMATLYTAYNEGETWLYYPPTGTANEPYRQIDFNQYNHNAPQPAGIRVANWTQVLQGSWSFTYNLPRTTDDAQPVANRDYIIPEDLLKTLWGVSTIYYGIAIYDAANSRLMAAATGGTISGTGQNVGTATLSYNTDYYVIPFFADRQITLAASLGGASIALIPNSAMGVMHTAQSGAQENGRYILSAVFGVTGRLSVTGAISTETFGGVQYPAHTFQNVTLYVCEPSTSAPETGAPSTHIYKEEYGNQYVAANSRWDFAESYRPTQNSVKCYLYENGHKHATANALKPDPVEPPTPTL